MEYDDVLLIHMGGLGDMCLSESTFLSLSEHFQKNLSALGYSRFFAFFQDYFKAINSIESVKWLYLFSDYPSENTWKRIVFIGKDKNHELRRRWQTLSREEMIFVDMFPNSAFIAAQYPLCSQPFAPIHIEDYQLAQLEQYDIKPLKKAITTLPLNRVILYPEASITKSKWRQENFVELYHSLMERGVEVYILESLGLELPVSDKLAIQNLVDVKEFFNAGGIFVSNDSGMAHFAGICGLHTITIYSDFDPAVWHPRGRNISLRLGTDTVNVPKLKEMIFQLMTDRDD